MGDAADRSTVPGRNGAPAEGPPARAVVRVRVLFVDDDPEMRELLPEMLAPHGADVQVAAGSDEAVRLLRDGRTDVIVSDVGMPGEDGFAMMRRIRALRREEGGEVPAIAVTGFAATEDARRALDAGFQEHLAKPLDVDRLADAIGRLTRTRS
jgi:CheY-like chemotaxis protein